MAVAGSSEIAATLEQAEQELQALVRDSEDEIAGVVRDFGDLACETDVILGFAAEIVKCVEAESILSVLGSAESLGIAARQFLQERLKATSGALDTVTSEARLLEGLSGLTREQRAIARETQTLSVLTNIEVARLGELGYGFQYLAHQLDDFSQAVAKGTKELAGHTEERKRAIEETRRMLAVELPQIRRELARMETDLGKALEMVNSRLTALLQTPEQFRACVGEIAGQIAGIVSAVQMHDITRQQLEHVGQGLRIVAQMVRGLEKRKLEMRNLECPNLADGYFEEAAETSRISAGLQIQAGQLTSIGQDEGEWVARIRSCIEGILRISCSEVVEIGPAVLLQVQELSAQLGGIETLEQDSQAVNSEVEGALAGLSSLMQLVGEHLERSTGARDRLRLLTFNSIIEASHLGARADAILEISQSIKRLAAVWSGITDRSGQAMEEILLLVKQVQEDIKRLSEEGNHGLRDAQSGTRAGLEKLRGSADFAARQAKEIETSTGRLQARTTAIGAKADRLEGCFARVGGVRKRIEDLSRIIEGETPGALGRCDRAEAESLFGEAYTTEIERQVLRAVLRGEPLPAREICLAGNDVELF
jgi:methyl-accepting chemotaxis protein